MKKKWSFKLNIIYLVLVYFFIYSNINFIKFFNLSIPIYLSLFGVGLIGLKLFLNKKIRIKKSYLIVFSISLFLNFYWWYGNFINNKIEVSPFNYYFLKQIRFLAASYFIFYIYKIKYKEKYYEKVLLDIVKVILFDNLLALIRFINPIINEKLTFIQTNGSDLKILEELANSKIRLVGFGEAFFGAGMINSIALILIIYLIKYLNNKNYFLIGSYIFIFLIGTLSSRTTLIGVGISIFYYSYLNSKNTVSYLRKIFLSSVVFLSVSFGLIFILVTTVDTFKNIYEVFFVEYGSKSILHLFKMWEIIPKEVSTLFFGDFRWNEYEQGKLVGYYKNTDVGYLRIIWATGLLGLINFITYSVLLCKNIKMGLYKNERALVTNLLILQLILNLKGYIDILMIVYFLLIVYEDKKVG